MPRSLSRRRISSYVLRMNRFERPSPIGAEAQIEYLDGDYRVLRHGTFVRCSVTGDPIAIDDLRYWSVERQEAYSGPEAVMRRVKSLKPRA
jgi:hypothetical protein